MPTSKLKKSLGTIGASSRAIQHLDDSQKQLVLSGQWVWDGYMKMYSITALDPRMVRVPSKNGGFEAIRSSDLGTNLYRVNRRNWQLEVFEQSSNEELVDPNQEPQLELQLGTTD
jgi:hypothetical protein